MRMPSHLDGDLKESAPVLPWQQVPGFQKTGRQWLFLEPDRPLPGPLPMRRHAGGMSGFAHSGRWEVEGP